jgi:hypothetical protein
MRSNLSVAGNDPIGQHLPSEKLLWDLNDLIFQRGDPQRALPPIRFWDVPPS